MSFLGCVVLLVVGVCGIPGKFPNLDLGRAFLLLAGIRSGWFDGLASMGCIPWQGFGNLWM